MILEATVWAGVSLLFSLVEFGSFQQQPASCDLRNVWSPENIRGWTGLNAAHSSQGLSGGRSVPRGALMSQASFTTEMHGPGGPVYLVERIDLFEPDLELSAKVILDFWISSAEAEEIFAVAGGRENEFPILLRVGGHGGYGTLKISPLEVSSLDEECRRFLIFAPGLSEAMARIRIVCDVARSQQLGIVIVGE